MINQLAWFGVVGVSAMLVHWISVVILVPLGLVPLIANIVAFLIAFQVSYWGHRIYTFKAHLLPHNHTLPRFFAVATGSFLINEGMYFLLLRYSNLDYRVSLIIVLVTVAALTFVLSRQWAFSNA